MPQPSRYTCNSCGMQTTIDVSDIELGNLPGFGDKVPCSSCGQVGCTYTGPA